MKATETVSNVWIEPPRPGCMARARVGSLADVAAIESFDSRALLPAWTLLGALERTAAIAPRKNAIVALERDDPMRIARQMTYGELVGALRATVNRLQAVSGDAKPVVSILA